MKPRKRHIKRAITTVYEDLCVEDGLDTVHHTTIQPLLNHFESILRKTADKQLSNFKSKLEFVLNKNKNNYDSFTFSGKIYQHEDIDIGYDYVEDNGYGIAVTIYGHRTETDKEYERRTAREDKAKAKQKAKKDKELASKKELYLKLKKEFEDE